jgi:E217 collar protein gp28
MSGVPGSNLLAEALQLIEPQTVRYFQWTDRATSATGRQVSEFAPGVDIEEGSLQAVPLTRYAMLGLDLKKKYTSWFVTVEVVGVDRDRAGDCYEFNGRRYQVVTETNWFTQDGWVCVIGVDIGAAL